MDTSPYPIRFSIDYPARTLDRTTTFFRLIDVNHWVERHREKLEKLIASVV